MEIKKSSKADLEGKKGVFFEIGLVLALGILLFAFEWKSDSADAKEIETVAQVAVEEEIIPVTQQEVFKPMRVRIPQLTDVIDIVPDDQDIDEELEILDAEDESENTNINMNAFGDYGDEDTGEAAPFRVVEEMPTFEHGSVTAWIAKNMKYPVIAQENGIQGRVYIQFVIERDGSVSNVEVVRGVDASLDKEAVRVVSSMPKWKPGKQRGKAVRVFYSLPITFALE